MFPPDPRPRRAWPRVLAALVAVLIAGVFLGGRPGWMPHWLQSVVAPQDPSATQVKQVLGLLDTNYYRHVDNQRLTNVGLQAAVDALNDPYSRYVPPAQQSQFNQELNPSDSGIGVLVSGSPHGLTIDEVYAGSPAARAGIAQGDVIVAVGGRSLAGMMVTPASNLIRGRAGTKVTLTFRHGSRRRTVTITRQSVTIPVTTDKLIHYHGIPFGYLLFTTFAQGSAAELRKEVRAMVAQGAKGLILDLRQNPGGLVDQAVAVASLFIPDGTILSTRGRNQPTTVYRALGDAIAPTIPLTVLVDRGTASAAEIVTAALKERGRAKVIGTRTYGKGVFQESQTLPNGGILDITVGQFFTPDGHNLGGSGVIRGRSVARGPGIAPDVYVAENTAHPTMAMVGVAERVLAGELK